MRVGHLRNRVEGESLPQVGNTNGHPSVPWPGDVSLEQQCLEAAGCGGVSGLPG